jgi:DNA-3-methyladenine glycosylase
MSEPLDRSFFARPTLQVAEELLGKRLLRVEPDGQTLTGLIIETEAYIGPRDLACHGKSGRTARNSNLWGPPGLTYVYFTYGMHWLLNFVTERDDFPAAVLIRAILPERGVEKMRLRRNGAPARRLTDGPAKLCQALAIDGAMDGVDACAPDSPIRLQDRPGIASERILRGPRVGIDSVPEPWKSVPWRFRLGNGS